MERLWSSSPKQYAIVSGSSAHSADPTFTASLLVRAADRRHDAPGAATPQAGTAADPGLVRRRVATRSAPTEQFGVGICHWPRGPPCAVRRSTGTGNAGVLMQTSHRCLIEVPSYAQTVLPLVSRDCCLSFLIEGPINQPVVESLGCEFLLSLPNIVIRKG